MLHCRISHFAQYALFYQSVLHNCLILFSLSRHFLSFGSFYMADTVILLFKFHAELSYKVAPLLKFSVEKRYNAATIVKPRPSCSVY